MVEPNARDREVLLTPTARLARAVKQRLAAARVERGASAWVAPVVMAMPAWIARLLDEWLLAGDDDRVPISSAQALVLWREVIDREIFIGEPRVAEMAAGAWRLVHEYCLEPPEQWTELRLNEDSRRFRDWARRFQTVCDERGLIDEWRLAASLPELIGDGRIELPPAIRLTGFELPMTPLQRAVLDAVEAAGTRVERDATDRNAQSPQRLVEFSDTEAELRAAAGWARRRLDADPDQRIAIVVPDLREHLARVERVFRQAFDPPGFALESSGGETGHEPQYQPWHISMGPPLTRWALVGDALRILRTDPQRLSQAEAAGLVRSPFLAGAVDEHDARARALAELVSRKPWWLDAGQLAWAGGEAGANRLRLQLGQWRTLRQRHRAPALPSQWVERFQKELDALGFGYGRTLDSREYQVLQRFHDLLEEFGALDVVVPRPISRTEAARRFAERAAAVAFRERNPGAPVEILGVEEALGSRFDAVWITTLDNRTWPSAVRRDPFIPGPVQQTVPGATVDCALERARAELDGLLAAAPEVRGSFARGSDDERRDRTPLLAGRKPDEAKPPSAPDSAPMESIAEDVHAPPHPGEAVGGGTGVLQRQSDCPFRAFAVDRLGAGDLTPPRPGLDARDRGSLVHKALERFWEDLEGRDALRALNDSARASRIEAACRAALDGFTRRSPQVLSDAGVALELECLQRALQRWLAIERERGRFSIKAREQRVEMRFDDLVLTGKIDRIDEIDGGGAFIIDYKTGASGKNGWAPDERLADVQLPAYGASLVPRPVAIAFARLRPDSMGFDGLAEVDTGTPGVEVIGQASGRSKFGDVETWPALIEQWHFSLERLAEAFVAGHAEVDPRDRQVCRYCHLHSLCRIHERRQWTTAQWTTAAEEDGHAIE